MDYSTAYIRQILADVKSVAMVGVSGNVVRPSYFVGRYLSLRGYRVLPVHPLYAGQTLFDAQAVASLKDLAARESEVHMIDIFRRSSEAGAVVDEAMRRFLKKGLKVIWMQIGVIDEAAAKRAEAEGLRVVMDRCPKIENQRLNGELSIGGFNSGVISSKLR